MLSLLGIKKIKEDKMSDFLKVIGFTLVVLAVLIGVSFFGLGMKSFFSPKFRAVEQKVFHESEQYNDGMIRDFQNLRLEYLRGTPEQKEALKGTILHRMSVYPKDRLPIELRSFYFEIQGAY
jgi:hypothetical protein